jgi:hypothetical protein
MSRPRPAAPLRLVQPAAEAVDELLAALENWAARSRDGEPVAYLEAGDGELLGGFPLTVGKVAELACLLRRAASANGGTAEPTRHHTEGDRP